MKKVLFEEAVLFDNTIKDLQSGTVHLGVESSNKRGIVVHDGKWLRVMCWGYNQLVLSAPEYASWEEFYAAVRSGGTTWTECVIFDTHEERLGWLLEYRD